jgi:hypothetical protein
MYVYIMHTLKDNLFFHSSAMLTILLQVVIVSAISHALWKLLQRFFFKSALDNIPGPPSQSFLFGDFLESLILQSALLLFTSSPGVFPQVFNPKGWDFQKDIVQKCMNMFQFSTNKMLMPRRWSRY